MPCANSTDAPCCGSPQRVGCGWSSFDRCRLGRLHCVSRPRASGCLVYERGVGKVLCASLHCGGPARPSAVRQSPGPWRVCHFPFQLINANPTRSDVSVLLPLCTPNCVAVLLLLRRHIAVLAGSQKCLERCHMVRREETHRRQGTTTRETRHGNSRGRRAPKLPVLLRNANTGRVTQSAKAVPDSTVPSQRGSAGRAGRPQGLTQVRSKGQSQRRAWLWCFGALRFAAAIVSSAP